ncbi:hypothetical protein [Kitasatospora sp. NPDC088783]|uniref:hypothetical protein n=1 Tax=Kitasatospora sp. NPDC088783 TaxID=3364077 RepID=UPI0038256591
MSPNANRHLQPVPATRPVDAPEAHELSGRDRAAALVDELLAAAAELQCMPGYVNGDHMDEWHVPASKRLLEGLAELAAAVRRPELELQLRRLDSPRCYRDPHPGRPTRGVRICGRPVDAWHQLCPEHQEVEDRARAAHRAQAEAQTEQARLRRAAENLRALQRPCPRCEARPGSGCTTRNGNPCDTHTPRKRDRPATNR